MKVYGLIGYPVAHSVSPAMQNAAFRQANINAVYGSYPVASDDLAKAVAGVKALGIAGFNVTIPYKQSIIQYLDSLDAGAERIKAVNTVKNEGGLLKGFNTDGAGAIEPLKKKTTLRNESVLVLGAGGAARSVCYALVDEGTAHIHIANRTLEKAQLLAGVMRKEGGNCTSSDLSPVQLSDAADEASIVINCTSVGMHPDVDATPIPAKLLKDNMIVEDIVYNPLKTRLLAEAEKIGAQTIPGVQMLVWQGALSYKIWTNRNAPVELMKSKALEALGEIK